MIAKKKPQKKKLVKNHQVARPERGKLSAEESLKRMEEFPKRREAFIAAIRAGDRRMTYDH